MLLTETIRKSTSAIQKRRSAQESKKSAEDYAKALVQLAQVSESLKSALDCATAMKTKGIAKQPFIMQQTRDELIECANDCGKGVFDGTLTLDMVKVLKTKSDVIAVQIQIVWKNESAKYCEGIKGYLSMIGGLSDNPKRAKELADNITNTVDGAVSIKAVDKLVADVSEARKITEAFSLNPEIEVFLQKVSSQQATVIDLTPNVLTWLKEKQLTNKLKIRF